MGLLVNTVSEGGQAGTSPTRTTANDAHGKRLIPHIIDQTAAQAPQKECFQFARSSLPEDGWRSITFRQFANAINKCCHLIIAQCGKPTRGTFPTIAYIGPNDARYLVLLLAAVKTGYKALFISPRNTQEGQLDLFEKTDCRILAFAQTQQSMVQPWLLERDMKALEIEALDAWFPTEPEEVAHYPFDKTFEEAEWEPLCVLHTSGSTGLPKPIVIRQGMLAIIDAYHDLGEWQGMNVYMREWAARAKRMFMAMPLFHAAGIYVSILTMYWDISVALGIADRPLSAGLATETLKYLDVQGAIIPPSVLEDMSHDEEGIKALAKLKVVPFGGGSLSTESGDRLVKHGVYLMSVVASTECCTMPLYPSKDPSMWQWFAFRFDEGECEWRKQGDGDIYEQVIVRKGKGPGLQPFFYTFPDKDEVSTSDLYRLHPTLPHHWTHHGRADDVLVFSNGEKLHPATIEDIVGAHPQVKGALVVGSGRFQPALILEPTKDAASEQERNELVDSVWPWIERANKVTVAHGRISRDLVMVAQPAKPFLRAGKGSLQKASTLKLYASDIDDLYQMAAQAPAMGASTMGTPSLDVSSEEALTGCIGSLFHDHLGGAVLDPDDDFFSAGVDSLQVISATRLLHAGLEAAGHPVALNPRTVYNNATPRRLAQYILQTTKTSESGDGDDDGSTQDPQTASMAALLDKYTRDLPRGQPGRPDPAREDQTVVLTGSTGALGSYLLDALVRSPRVRKVICLNRAADGGAAQQARAMAARGLDDDAYKTKAEFFHVDATDDGDDDKWGLPPDVYARLLRETDRVILNAWPVNFNLAVSSFEPHVRGVRAAAAMAARAAKRPAVLFVSSVGTVAGWDTGARGPVPEAPLADLGLAVGGYGASKLVASLVLDAAAAAGDFPAAVVRVGQIAGPEADAGGVWNRHEWFPSLVASSLYLKAFPAAPAAQARVDWTPIERIARLVLEVGGVVQDVEAEAVSGYYHGVNPATTTWDAVAAAVRSFYGEARLPETVPFGEWVRRLERSGQDSGDGGDIRAAVSRNPGLKLLDTYREMAQAEEAGRAPVILAVERTVGRSPTMRGSEAITADLVKLWCKQWDF